MSLDQLPFKTMHNRMLSVCSALGNPLGLWLTPTFAFILPLNLGVLVNTLKVSTNTSIFMTIGYTMNTSWVGTISTFTSDPTCMGHHPLWLCPSIPPCF